MEISWLRCSAAAVAAATSTGGHWPPDRAENALSLSLSPSTYSEHAVKGYGARCFNSIFRYCPKEKGNFDGDAVNTVVRGRGHVKIAL